MKTKLFSIGAIALSMVATSCNHARIETGEPENEPVKVTFNVSALDVNIEPMTRASKNASAGLQSIGYILVNSDGTKTGTQTASSNPDTFGTIEMWLSPGTYTAYFAGFAGDGSLLDNTNNFQLWGITGDTFFKTMSLTIGSANSYDITLERICGQLVVDLTDESVPTEIKGCKLQFLNEDAYIIKDGSTSANWTNGNINVTDGAFAEYTHYTFPTPANAERELTIQLIDNDNAVLGETSVSYRIYKNRKTIVRGNILDIITQKGLTITYNDDWGDDNVVTLE